ncbi:hypothetical protein BCR33DRAFT_764241 [Rhizoclosmatium globosum]|uniref:Uncharacterized protein n=1 Tax=Rhizoclosmatium globosum TaxID=329046 RepID=A0A1Y2CLI5_9FUNG|nr:hypothetical protein BCR33DRAFT_764241 [Rhizoclosmatium globosum]|eukprot:ORY47889.1 hypothetical protein BCR33DRAFT_764241 [Rhizoclosmatium globosum]
MATKISCVLSENGALSLSTVSIDSANSTVRDLKHTVCAAGSPDSNNLDADKLLLIRTYQGDVGGLTTFNIKKLKEALNTTTFGNIPELTTDQCNNSCKFSPTPGVCLTFDGLTFKVMNSREKLSFFTASLPDDLHHVLVLIPPKPLVHLKDYVNETDSSKSKRKTPVVVAKPSDDDISVLYSLISTTHLEKDGFFAKGISLAQPESDFANIPPFTWPTPTNNDFSESNESYLAYIRDVITPIDAYKNLSVLLSPDENLLDLNLTYHWRGCPDVIVAPRASASCPRNQLGLLFILKPDLLTSENIVQACAQVAAANLLFGNDSAPSPVGVLTDLKDGWILIWMEGTDKCIHYAEYEFDLITGDLEKLKRDTAVFYIQRHLHELNSIMHPFNRDQKKRKQPDVRDSVGFGKRVGKLKLKRQVTENDRMADLYDEMTAEEIESYEMRKALLLLEQSFMPRLSK